MPQSRAETAAKRVEELDRWRAERADGHPTTRADDDMARWQRAYQAHMSAAQIHDEAARMHDSVADSHDRARLGGHGDSATHLAVADEHRHTAEHERSAAGKARARALKDPPPDSH